MSKSYQEHQVGLTMRGPLRGRLTARDRKNVHDSHDHFDPLTTETSPLDNKGISRGKVSNVSSGT